MQVDNLFKKISYITLLISFVLVIYVAYSLFYTPPYFETKQPFKLEKTEYKMGETLVYTSEYCKYRNYVPVSIIRNLVNDYSYPLPNVNENVQSLTTFSPGCKTVKVEVSLVVNPRIPTGKNHKYHVEITIVYPINQFRNEIRVFKTEDFILLPNESI